MRTFRDPLKCYLGSRSRPRCRLESKKPSVSPSSSPARQPNATAATAYTKILTGSVARPQQLKSKAKGAFRIAFFITGKAAQRDCCDRLHENSDRLGCTPAAAQKQ